MSSATDKDVTGDFLGRVAECAANLKEKGPGPKLPQLTLYYYLRAVPAISCVATTATMVSSAFTPLQSLIGGLMMAGGVSGMLAVQGQVLGISGMYHGSIDLLLAPMRPAALPMEGKAKQSALQSRSTAVLFTSGLVLGGVVLGVFRAHLEAGLGIRLFDPPGTGIPLTQLVLWGVLVGFGTRWGRGCTSGHFLCGLSRLSGRSIVATGTFFSAAVGTHLLVTEDILSSAPIKSQAQLAEWKTLAWLQLPLWGYAVLPALVSRSKGSDELATLKKQTVLADLASFATGMLPDHAIIPLKL